MRGSFVDLASDQKALIAALSRMKTVDADEMPGMHVLNGGVSSNVMRIDTRRGSFCLKQALPALKVEKEWHASVERIFIDIAWLRAAGAIVPENVPTVIAVDDSTGSFLMTYLQPEQYVGWKQGLMAGDTVKGFAAQLGTAMNRIHTQTAGNPQMIEIFDRPFNEENFMALRLDAYLLETGRNHPNLSSYFESLVQSFQQNKHSVIHGDISPKNILAGPSGPVILDAECACYGDPAFDIAFLLNHLLLKAAHNPSHSAALLDDFDEFAEAYFSAIAWEPRKDLEMRVARLLPGLLLARVDGKSPVEYLNSEQRADVRRLALELIEQQNASLPTIQSFWSMEIRP